MSLTFVPQVREDQPPAEFVRLSQLRKLRRYEQVAAVCYRVRGGCIEFLLVRTRGSGRWTFPKGSAEPGLTHAQAAALEAFEEAGVHGRIEEASFARYGRRAGRGASAKRSDKELAVNAHLCEVLRLSPPQESKRDRTWFSIDEARRRLCEGRKRSEGAEFGRVVDRAVARLERLRGEGRLASGVQVDPLQDDPSQDDRARRVVLPKDALQKVQFDFAESYGRLEVASVMPHIRRQISRMQRFDAPILDAHGHEVLRGEVLQFEPARTKRVKALREDSCLRS